MIQGGEGTFQEFTEGFEKIERESQEPDLPSTDQSNIYLYFIGRMFNKDPMFRKFMTTVVDLYAIIRRSK